MGWLVGRKAVFPPHVPSANTEPTCIGYDGHFLFDNIGDSYIENKVPYVAFRAMPAMLSTLTVPVVFLTMWESGYSLPACLVSAGLVLFGTSRL